MPRRKQPDEAAPDGPDDADEAPKRRKRKPAAGSAAPAVGKGAASSGSLVCELCKAAQLDGARFASLDGLRLAPPRCCTTCYRVWLSTAVFCDWQTFLAKYIGCEVQKKNVDMALALNAKPQDE